MVKKTLKKLRHLFFSGVSATLVLMSKAVGSITAVLLIDKFGRRILIIFSQICVCACLFPLATFFYIQDNSCLATDAKEV